jgi:hypothetical protein
MRAPLISFILLVGLAAGCAGESSVKPVEMLDERTGVTLAALKEPIELLPDSSQNSALIARKRLSFAYLGPVEWNRAGTFSYGLWIHIAPGDDRQAGDIHNASALILTLDDGPVTLSTIEAPNLGRAAYQDVVAWGQTAYFDLSVDTLRRMAASAKLELDVRAADGSVISFAPPHDTRPALTKYLQDRGIAGD